MAVPDRCLHESHARPLGFPWQCGTLSCQQSAALHAARASRRCRSQRMRSGERATRGGDPQGNSDPSVWRTVARCTYRSARPRGNTRGANLGRNAHRDTDGHGHAQIFHHSSNREHLRRERARRARGRARRWRTGFGRHRSDSGLHATEWSVRGGCPSALRRRGLRAHAGRHSPDDCDSAAALYGAADGGVRRGRQP